VEADDSIRHLQIVDGTGAELGFNESAKSVPPVSEGATEGERKIDFVQKLVSREQGFQEAPGVSEVKGPLGIPALKFTTGTVGAEDEEWPGGDERVAGFGDFEATAPE